MPQFNGQLRSNEIFAALYNMIISQQVFADNIAGTKSSLVDRARVDGSLYGDTKLYYATDVLKSAPWGNDAEAANLLNLYRPDAPDCQAIYIDQFRQICLTVDNYLSKRAWSTEGAFSEFNSVMLQWIRDTKRVYDSTTYNSFIGTNETDIGGQEIVIDVGAPPAVTDTVATEAYNRLVAQTIAARVSDLFVELEDVSRDFNDYGNLRSYNSESLIAVWNSVVVNRINKVDVPMIFNGLEIDKKGEYTLPARYFGTKNADAGTAPSPNTTVRSLIETDYGATHVFPGDLLPAGAEYTDNTTYTVDATIAFKIMHKRSVPYMSAFEVGTSFFNPKSLTETHYLTYGHNTLEHLKNYPFITVRLNQTGAAGVNTLSLNGEVQNDGAPSPKKARAKKVPTPEPVPTETDEAGAVEITE